MSPSPNDSKERKIKYPKKIWIAVGILSLAVIFFLLFKTLFSVLLLTVAAILMAVYFLGCADFFERILKVPRGWALAISIVLNILLLTAFFWFVGARLESQISEMSDTLPKTIENGKAYLQQSKIGGKLLNYLDFSSDSQKTISIARQLFSSTFGIISDLYIILLLAVFFIAGPKTYRKGMIKLLPDSAKQKGSSILTDLYVVLKKWIKGQLFGFLFIAVLSGLGLWILGMPMILTLALLAGILNFIPNFGPVIALIPAGLLGLMEGPTTALLVICLYTFIQIVQSAVTQPLIQKKMVNIPPALVIFGQVAMGMLGGFWGVLLATPIVAIIMTLVNKLYVEKNDSQLIETT